MPAAIHVTPEAFNGGLLAKVKNGDLVELNTQTGELTLCVDDSELDAREPAKADLDNHHEGMGRELFAGMRSVMTGAEEGACSLFYTQEQAL